MSGLDTKYRPKTFDKVVGQRTAVKTIESALKRKQAKAFLLIGPSGVGKTTLARIACKALGCVSVGAILEIDAADNTGVDDTREIKRQVQYQPLGGEQRAVIMDECHRLSANAWDSLLKMIEEPPPHLTWWLCTTDPTKIPETVRTRCIRVQLQDVGEKDLRIRLDQVIKMEKLTVDDDIKDIVIREANGSPRQMLVNLEAVIECKSDVEAAEALRSALKSEIAIDLAKFLLAGKGSWAKAMTFVEELQKQGTSPESVRYVVSNYVAGALKRSNTDNRACALLGIIEAFSTPYPRGNEMPGLLRSIGMCLYSGG
jgi:DNA polymerase III subunit gamma/tau